MAILFHKPPGFNITELHLKNLNSKFRFAKISRIKNGKWTTESFPNQALGLSFPTEDNVIGVLSYAEIKYPIIFGDYLFFHEGVFSKLNSGEEFLQGIISDLSLDGSLSLLDLAFTDTDASILASPQGVMFSKYKWHVEDGVKYSSIDYKSPPIPPSHRSESYYPQTHTPRPRLCSGRNIVSTNATFSEISVGMGMYFNNSRARMFVDQAGNGTVLMPMDIIISAEGHQFPSFETLQGLVVSRIPFNMEIFRYPFQDPNKTPVSHKIRYHV